VTPRRYATPEDFKQALEAQLRGRVGEATADLPRWRQRCVFERFLARLSVQFGERAVIKGGVALLLRLERGRSTRDLDLRMSTDPDGLFDELVDAGQLALEQDFVTFVVERDPSHPTIDAESMAHPGQRFRVEPRLAGKLYGSRFGLDVAFGDPMASPPETLTGSDLLAFAGIPPVVVLAYAREVHVAEKLHALTVQRARPNSRVKDLPDLALLATTGPFRSDALRGAIEATFDRRGTPVPVALGAPPEHWRPAYARMARENPLRWASLDDVAHAVRAFLDPVLRGDEGSWDPQTWSWLPGP
jgi:hypothetical protein